MKAANPQEWAEPSQDSPHRSLQRLVDQVAGYSIGAVFNRILGIIVACVYPLLLSKEEYGRLDVILSIPPLLACIFYLGLDSSLPRFYYDENRGRQRERLVSATFNSVILFTLIAVVLLLLFSRSLALWLYQDARYILYFRLMLIGMPFTMASSIAMVVLRLQGRIRAFNILMAANLLIAAMCGITSILLLRIAASGVLVGFIAGNMATAAAGIWIIRADLAPVMPLRELTQLLTIGFPLALSGFAMWLIGFVNRPILVRHVSADDIGLYAIASGAVAMFGLLIAAFRNAWQPFAFSIMEHREYKGVYARALTLFTAVGATAAVGLSLFAPQVLLLINLYTHKDWSGAAQTVGPLALGIILSAMFSVIQTGAFIARRTGVIVVTVGIAALINAGLNFLWIPWWGMMGAALATAVGHLASLVIGYLFAQRLEPIPYHIRRLSFTILAASVAIATGSRLHSEMGIHDLLLRSLILIGFCGLLLVGRIINRDDLLLFRNINWFAPHKENQAGRAARENA